MNNDWIPCSERLPKESGPYLVSYEGFSFQQILNYSVKYKKFNAYDTQSEEKVKECALTDVSAWMPLPEPYSPANQWIPCTKRLPEERVNPTINDYYEYPVTVVFGEMSDVRYLKYGNGHWWYEGQCMDKYVIAWMQIPEPYKEAKE